MNEFDIHQVPVGGDQCKRMTVWTPRPSQKPKILSSVERYFDDNEVTAWRKDMWNNLAGAEGLQDAELIHW